MSLTILLLATLLIALLWASHTSKIEATTAPDEWNGAAARDEERAIHTAETQLLFVGPGRKASNQSPENLAYADTRPVSKWAGETRVFLPRSRRPLPLPAREPSRPIAPVEATKLLRKAPAPARRIQPPPIPAPRSSHDDFDDGDFTIVDPPRLSFHP